MGSLLALGLLLLLSATLTTVFASPGLSLGVNYGTVANNLPAPSQAVALLQSTIITKVKLFSVDADILHALANTGFEVAVGIGNDQIKPLASSVQVAKDWVQANVVPFMPATNITYLSVGNEVLSTSDGEMIYVLQFALRNLHTALQQAGLTSVKVTTPHSMGLLQSSVPPSNGSFGAGPAAILPPILSFLASTSAPFMVNAYPFFGFLGNPNATQLQYALFNSSTPRYDNVTRLNYDNMFDAQIDAVYAAIAKLGFHNVSVAVGETGWPSHGDQYAPGVSLENAKTFNSNLVKHLNSGKGTPLKPNSIVETYIFALFNENLKPGAESEKNYGLFAADMTPVYDCGIMKTTTQRVASGPAAGSGPSSRGQKQWCVAKSTASPAQLQAVLDWACKQAGTDCRSIQPSGACYSPNTLQAHASFAMNSYYQHEGRHAWNCDFAGAGLVVNKDPSYTGCVYSAGN